MHRNPEHGGEIEEPDAELENRSCGDHTELSVKENDDEIAEVRHSTEGCVICTAAAEITAEKAEGLEKEEAEKLGLEDVEEEMGTELGPVRKSCAELPLKALKEALK